MSYVDAPRRDRTIRSAPAGCSAGCWLAAAWLCALFTMGSTLSAQSASLSGSVRDEAGRPIRDALVVIDPESLSLRVRSDTEGRFRIGGVPIGRFEIRVVRLGFRPHTEIVDFTGTDVSVDVVLRTVPLPLDTVTVRVAQLGLHGQVVTRGMALLPHEPRPLRGAIVEVLKEPYRATSGTDGRFSIDQLGEGAHAVVVRLDRFASRMVMVYVPPDGGVDVSVVLDSVVADYQRKDDALLRSIGRRLRAAPNPSAFVTAIELAGPERATLEQALRVAPSTLSRGLVVRNDITCLYVNGVPRPGLTAADVLASEVQSVEVYGAPGSAASVPLDDVPAWNSNTFCGSGSRPGVMARPADRPPGDRPPRTTSGDNIARVLLIWTTRRW